MEHLRAVLRTTPDFGLAHLWLGRALQRAGRLEEAIAEYDLAGAAQGEWPVPVAARGHACGEAGRHEEARAALARLEHLAGQRHVTPYAPALVHAALGEVDAALRWLALGLDERTPWVVWLPLDPRLDRLRGEPRFRALARRLGLTEARS